MLCETVSSRVAMPLTAALLLCLMQGCASPGPPRAPSLRLPERVTDLEAQRRGGAVDLRFTTPTRTADGLLLNAPVIASLCRAVDDGPCQPTASFPGGQTVTGTVVWKDILPAELASGADRRLTYKVQLFNPDHRTAGWSDAAWAAAGEAPPGVDAFIAEGSREGIILRWQTRPQAGGEVFVERVQPGTAPSPAAHVVTLRPASPRKKPAPAPVAAAAQTSAVRTLLHAEMGVQQDRGGLIDASAQPDVAYRYTAFRSRAVVLGGKPLELHSESTRAVELTLHDVYPPLAPQGLLAAAFPVEPSATFAVDLNWQPVEDPDLAGYNVYRSSLSAEGGNAAVPVRLNASPILSPAFRDSGLGAGARLRYTVTAVDRHGNESAPSSAADVTTAP